ncbi:MAG: phosphotransferase [Bacteroidales bacterium]|nr:phosphotransferase [Bacteroidales bacterium]
MKSDLENLKELFKQWSGNFPDNVTVIPPSGSERRYFRLKYQGVSAIGVWNPVKEENSAFLHFTRHFLTNGLHVPSIYSFDPENNIYLIEDLGDTSLFSLLENKPPDTGIPQEIIRLYQESLRELVRFQVKAGKSLDYNYCYPHSSFDTRSMKWDLNYFKYYFLKLHVPFHEGKLEDDFDTLVNYLNNAESDYFMYRDFQSRNILVKGGIPYFIDYQGGRRGPLQYDIASLLFQVKADLPFPLREELLDFYFSELSPFVRTDQATFKKQYYGFVLIRLLQVLGAYGFRGLIEKKLHFLSSIPFALKNLDWWLTHVDLQLNLPELLPAIKSLAGLEKYQKVDVQSMAGKFTVLINSFSYKHGIPDDLSGHGGGFVFDCRALPNPGREERYRVFNGKEKIIIDYLRNSPEVIDFLKGAEKLVSQSVENYTGRGFSRLMVSFGCTGGQHRSVYCAESLASRLKQKYPQISIEIAHKMLDGLQKFKR